MEKYNIHASEVLGCKVSSDFMGFVLYDSTGKFSVWSSSDLSFVHSFWIKNGDFYNERYFDLNYSDGLFACFSSGRVVVYDFRGDKSFDFLVPSDANVLGVGFCGGYLCVLCGSFILLFDFFSGALKRFNNPSNEIFGNLIFRSDGVISALIGFDKVFSLDVDDGNWIELFDFHGEVLFDVKFSPDGEIAAVASTGKIVFFDINSKKILQEIIFNDVRDFCWAPNSRLIICNGSVYDVYSGEFVFGGFPYTSGFVDNENIFWVDGVSIYIFNSIRRKKVDRRDIFVGGFDPRILNFSGAKFISYDGLGVRVCGDHGSFEIIFKNNFDLILKKERADFSMKVDVNLLFNLGPDVFNNIGDPGDDGDKTDYFLANAGVVSLPRNFLVMDYDFALNKRIIIFSHPGKLTAYSFDGAIVWEHCHASPVWVVMVSGDENLVCAIQGDGVVCWRFVDDGRIAFSAVSIDQKSIAWCINGINYKSVDDEVFLGELVFDEFGVGRVDSNKCKKLALSEEDFFAAVFGSTRHVVFNLGQDGFFARPDLYILSVGVGAYRDPGVSNLNFSAKDAKDFCLAMSSGGKNIYGNINSRVITDDQATFDNVIEGVEWICRSVTQHDVGMVFLSGHGFNDSRIGYLFLPFDVQLNKIRKTAVPMGFVA